MNKPIQPSKTPNFWTLWKHPVHLLAFGFGSGLSPKAPGTFGTLAAIPFYYLFSYLPLSYYIGLVLILMLFSFWVCHVTSQDLGVHDYPGIVMDEMVGYWITMIHFPHGLFWVIGGFLWFRLFDIWKPWPISWIQENVKGGIGIVLDDVAAGIFAWIALFLTGIFLTGGKVHAF